MKNSFSQCNYNRRTSNIRMALIILFTVIMFASCIATIVINMAKAQGEFVLVADSVTREEYLQGEEYSVKQAKISFESSEKTASSKVYAPNGSLIETDVFTLTDAGQYTIVYSADFEGQTKTAQVNVISKMPLFEMSGKNDICVAQESTLLGTSVKGNQIKISEGETATANYIIDFNKLSKSSPLIEFYVVPEKPSYGLTGGMANYLSKNELYEDWENQPESNDFESITITLTDVYDENNYITIYYIRAQWDIAYLMTSSRNNQLSGLQDGEGSRLFDNGRFGAAPRLSFSKMTRDIYSKGGWWNDGWQRLYFDYDSKQLYFSTFSQTKTLVLDYDNSEHVAELWEGFSKGQAKLSISCGMYTGSNPATMYITQLAGLVTDKGGAIDDIVPEIETDYAGQNSEALPKALVNRPYSIFKSTGLDSKSEYVDLEVAVFMDYYGTKTSVEVVDGAFIPDTAGDYYIEYIARDNYKNTTKNILKIVAVDELTPIIITLEDENYATSARLGEKITLPRFVSAGGSGVCQTNNYVIYENDSELIPIVNGCFTPYKIGKYYVQYFAKDYIGQTKAFHYVIDVEASLSPVFTNDIVMPKYILAGYTTMLPKLYAGDFSTGEENAVAVSISVQDSEGQRILSGLEYKPSKSTTGNAKIIYSATANGLTATKEFNIPIISVSDAGGSLATEKYFIGNNINSVAVKDSINICNLTADSEINYAKVLSAKEIEIRFTVPEKPLFDAVNLFVTDYADANKTIKFTYYLQSDGTASFAVNDGLKYTMSEKCAYETAVIFRFDGINGIAYPDGFTTVKVNNFYNGDGYSRFNNDSIYFSATVDRPKAGAVLSFLKINGQVVNERTTRDRIGPQVSILGKSDKRYQLGDTVTISRAIALDVFDTFASVTVSVLDGNGNPIVSNGGLLLSNVSADVEYTVTPTTPNSYTIIYTGIDSSGNDTPVRSFFEIVDDVVPTITLDGNIPNSAKVGQSIELPTAKISDNKDTIKDYVVYCKTENGIYQRIVDKSVSFSVAGTYKIIYMAFDSSGNMGEYTHKIIVA